MGKRIKLKPHLTIEELARQYREATDGRERSHWQMIWLLAQGKDTREAAAITGYTVAWVRELVRRYNARGAAALQDTRHANPGRGRLLNGEQAAALKGELERAERAGQPWNGRQVARWMSDRLGRVVNPVRGWEVLKRWGFRRKWPRPRHAKADGEEQAWFKKT